MIEIKEETKNGIRSLFVEKKNEDFITVKTIKDNKEYEVDLLVFDRATVKELTNYQASLYKERDEKGINELQKALARIFTSLSSKKFV